MKRMLLQILPLRPGQLHRDLCQDDNCLVVWMGGVLEEKEFYFESLPSRPFIQ